MAITEVRDLKVAQMKRLAVVGAFVACENSRVSLLCTTRMNGVFTIQFTQDQMRAVTGVTAETMRHWRKTIPFLASKVGKAARFSFSDLIGLMATQQLVSVLGVHVGHVRQGLDQLFRVLSVSGSVVKGRVAVISESSGALEAAGSVAARSLAEITVSVPLDPLIAKLQQHVLPVALLSPQAPLRFPPEAVRSRA